MLWMKAVCGVSRVTITAASTCCHLQSSSVHPMPWSRSSNRAMLVICHRSMPHHTFFCVMHCCPLSYDSHTKPPLCLFNFVDYFHSPVIEDNSISLLHPLIKLLLYSLVSLLSQLHCLVEIIPEAC